ncbi:hypothetical protein [Nocardiopsis synnemataformans]|uniref:hypothetical protein n=1 Tax=Nocardiopsis synnemataformans TaxID=61305 RepID=UPI003EBD8EB0
MDLARLDATGITHDGTRYRIHGHPATAIQAHKTLADAGMTDREQRIELLDSIKHHPEEIR